MCGSGHTLTGNIPQGSVYYDAARANMGEPLMMFTKEQGQELIDNTTYEWTTINEINGGKFTNKTDPLKYIFLPGGGYWKSTTYNYDGLDGHYWSASYRSSDSAWYFYFSYSNALWPNNYLYKSYGKSIRAVRPKTW